jgi:hypothetical protein
MTNNSKSQSVTMVGGRNIAAPPSKKPSTKSPKKPAPKPEKTPAAEAPPEKTE